VEPTDITYINTDLYDKIPVSYSFSFIIKKEWVIDSLKMTLKGRLPSEGLICHSDRGLQYCSHEYQQVLMDHQIRCSMSRKGNCYDNATTESFHAAIRNEYLHGRRFRTRQEAILGIFEYIEVFCLRERLQPSLG
jgi:putative transposase